MTQTTLREALEASVSAAETGTLSTPVDAPAIEATTPTQDAAQATAAAPASDGRQRDDQGRFAAQAEAAAAAPADTPVTNTAPARPTTWKKDYLPMYDKLATGVALTPEESRKLAAYNVQREEEFAHGIRIHRERADQAKHLTDAMTPFMPLLQQHNMQPGAWITSLGEAQRELLTGTPERKIEMFANLARAYGVPLATIQAYSGGQQVDPAVTQLMQQLQEVNSRVAGVEQYRSTQEDNSLQQEISAFGRDPNHPHFAAVQASMAQLLETGNAQTLEDAYEKAIWLDPEVRQAEIARQAQLNAPAAPTAPRPNAVSAAKAAAVSPKSATPAGAASVVPPTDRRALLAANMDAALGGRV